MPIPSEEPGLVRRHRLSTFGTLALAGPDDTNLGNRGSQRRRLALLAVLAAAGDRGRSRDELLLLFWPEVTQAKARHSLEQLIYGMRGGIDRDLFLGVNPVVLNPAVISSDVGDFNEALARGALQSAVETYAGPFVDGFYLGDAPEFEQWVGTARVQLERSYAGALERLAESADVAGDDAAAVRWWRALSELDPISAKNASGLIRALMNADDHAAALQHAERYEVVVRDELGTGAGPAVADLVAEVRARSPTRSVSASRPAAPAPQPRTPALAVPRLPEETSRSGTTDLSDGAVTPPTPPSRAWTRRRVAAISAMVVTLLAVTAVTLQSRATQGASAPSAGLDPSIAVLPLANVGGDPDDVALVDGLSEQLIASVAKIGNLRVIARTSAFAFKNSGLGVRRIADSLGVSHVLEGSVQKEGTQLRVHVRLVDARDGSTRWSETFDRELRDIFAVQSEIATAVAKELQLRLSDNTVRRIRRGSTSNVAAYELYVRGNDQAIVRTDSGVRVGLELFSQAIALDSNFAAAYAGLARMYLRSRSGDESVVARRERLALAEQAALTALALDDSLAEAHAVHGLVRRNVYDAVGAEAAMRRAVSLEPTNVRFREWLTQILVWTERPSEALAEAHRALELDPLSPTANAEVAHALLAHGRCDDARAPLARIRALRPPLQRVSLLTVLSHACRQDWPGAIAEAERDTAASGAQGLATLGHVLARGGRLDEARGILARLQERAQRTGTGEFEVAVVHAGLGDTEQVFVWLDRALTERSVSIWHLPLATHGLPSGPRRDRLLERLGVRRRARVITSSTGA